jgi:hypothetical protein
MVISQAKHDEGNIMALTDQDMQELERLEKISTVAAEAVSQLIPGSFVDNDGAATFVYIQLEDSIDGLHATAAVDTFDHGEGAKWTIHYEYGTEVWTSDYDSTTSTAVVAEWIQDTLKDYYKK